MSHYSTRINITVKNPEVWKKLHAIDMGQYGFSCTAAELFTGNSKSFIIEGDWSATNDELEELVDTIVNAAAKECVVIADTSDLNNDEPPYCVYYLGENVNADYYEGAASNAREAYYFKTLGRFNKNDLAAFWIEIDPGMDEVYPGGVVSDESIADVIMGILYNVDDCDIATLCKRFGVPFMAYEDFGRSESFGFQEDADINDITQWLQYASFSVTTAEQEYLTEYNIHI